MCQKNVRSREKNKNISVQAKEQCGEVNISHNSNVHVAFTSGLIFYITKHFCIKTWLLKLKLYPQSANFVVFCVCGDYTWSAELCHPIVFTKLKFTGFRFGGPRRGFFRKNLSTKNKCIGIELCHDTFIFYIYTDECCYTFLMMNLSQTQKLLSQTYTIPVKNLFVKKYYPPL